MRRLLRIENIGWRVFSLVAAIVLWATFVGSPEVVTSVFAPIEYRGMPSALEISSEVPDRVYIEIQGPGARLHSIDLARTTVTLDLSRITRPGEYALAIERGNIDLLSGLRVLRMVPSQVRLRFERRVSSDVPIRVRFAGPLPAGYRIAREQVSPSRVRIAGPESRVKETEFAETDPIDIARGTGEQVFRDVHISVRDPQVRLHAAAPVTVTVALRKE